MRRRLFSLLSVLLIALSITSPVSVTSPLSVTTPAGASNPGDLAARDFVVRQYEDFLTRAPDAGGLEYWTNLLLSGESPAALIEFMVASPEFEQSVAPMVRLYYAHLRRAPDYDGLRFWTGKLSNGTGIATISENFARSQEFKNSYGSLSDAEYVELVYLNVLDRKAEASGRDYWIEQLASGVTRGTMMALFAESKEFRNRTDGLVKASMLYVGLLQRAPDEAGLEYWSSLLNRGVPYRDIMSGFLQSTEYRNRIQGLASATHPLTGELTNGRSDRPALALKIDNAPGARPHVGLNSADIVYEEMVEGQLSRFIAIYQSQVPSEVGPIRSIRTGDFDVIQQFNTPLLGASGANRFVLNQLKTEPVINVNALVAGGAYYRVRGRSAPHNLITSPARLWEFAGNNGGTPGPAFVYRRTDATALPTATNVQSLTINFGSSTATYHWDQGANGWARDQNGTAHKDSRGQRIAPDNVVVQVTHYDVSAADSQSPEAVSVGSGQVFVLTNGYLVEGTWSRANPDSAVVLKDSSGTIIKLATGTTWVALAPPGSVTVRR